MIAEDKTRAVKISPKVENLPAGTMAGDYVIINVISSGGCGTVYSAKHRVLERPAAVKVMHPELVNSTEMQARFMREAKAAAMIRHPNIVDVFDFGNLPDGRPYYAMELLEGPNLSQLVQMRGRLSAAEALPIMEPICQALHAAHTAGIVHRDLKGSNVAIARKGDETVVKLLDFGIAKLIHPEPGEAGLTVAGRLLGTPSCMAPEQIRGGAIDARTDIYALGILLYQLLTGQMPFKATTSREMELAHLNTPPPPPSRLAPISPAIDAIVLQCLEKQPERRFPTAIAFLEAVREAVQGSHTKKTNETAEVMGVAVLVEARMSPEAQEDPTDGILADLGFVLDFAEQALRTADFLIPMQTGNAILGVRVLSNNADEARSQRREALLAALPLWQQLAERPDAEPLLHINLCVHSGKVQIRQSAQGIEVVGGELPAIADWMPQDSLDGLRSTASALDGLAVDIAADEEGRYLVVRGVS